MFQLNEVNNAYSELLSKRAVTENSLIQSHLKWQKAANDIALSEGLLKISVNPKLKDMLGYPQNMTFFDWVIVSAYYSIFHAAQALLGMKHVRIVDRMHYATLTAFAKHFVISGELEEELFFIYEDSEAKAKELLDIFEEEKVKRGIFQYHRLSRNNFEPAEQSVKNAKIFLEAVQEILKKNKII